MFNLLFSCSRENVKPLKKQLIDSKQQVIRYCNSSILSRRDINDAIILPSGEDLNEWLAAKSVEFFKEISLIWGIVCDLGTPSCPLGDGFPNGFEYRWADGDKFKTPVRCSGPEYVDYALTWVEDQFNDEAIFPVAAAVQFPRNFIAILKGICSKLFRILAIIFCCHLTILEELGAIPHLNTTFEHFLFFCWEFDMIKKCEEEALGDLIDDIRYRNSSG